MAPSFHQRCAAAALMVRQAAPKFLDGDGYLAALSNFRFMANGIWSTNETVGKLLPSAQRG
jgi:hypothetical protein